MLTEEVAARLRYVAANIRELRLERGWTQQQLGEAAGIETRYMQTLESGRANPSAAILIAIAEALRIEVGALFRPAELSRRRPGRPRAR